MFWAAGARPDTRLWKERNFSTRVLSRSLLSISPAGCPRIALLTSLTLIRAALLEERKKKIARSDDRAGNVVLTRESTTLNRDDDPPVYRLPSTVYHRRHVRRVARSNDVCDFTSCECCDGDGARLGCHGTRERSVRAIGGGTLKLGRCA